MRPVATLALAAALLAPAACPAALTPLTPADLEGVTGRDGGGALAGGVRTGPLLEGLVGEGNRGGANEADQRAPAGGGADFLRVHDVEVAGFWVDTPGAPAGKGRPLTLDAAAALGLLNPATALSTVVAAAVSIRAPNLTVHFDRLRIGAVTIAGAAFEATAGPSLGSLQIDDFTMRLTSGNLRVAGL